MNCGWYNRASVFRRTWVGVGLAGGRRTVGSIGSGAAIGIRDRVLAEAVRLHEEGQGATLNEPRADEAARTAGGDLERRIVVRAGAVAVADALRRALTQVRVASTLVVVVASIVALVAGATTARVAMGTTAAEPVNFFWVLGSLLGVHTIALLSWLVVIFVRPGDSVTGLLGGAALAFGRRLNRWLHKGPMHAVAARAIAGVFGGGAIGRWSLSSITHGLWMSFLAGCLLMVLLLLSTRQYSFAWETTILSDATYVAFARALAFLPEAIGFAVPNADEIAASRWTGAIGAVLVARQSWAGLLVGAIVVYGLLFRGFALLLSVWMWRRACRCYRLDLTHIGFARLERRVMPVATGIGVVDAAPETLTDTDDVSPPSAPVIATDGPVAILGMEIDRPTSGWPPAAAVEWLDLGLVDDRDDRHRALENVTAALPPPRAVVAVCSLLSTPDRGAGTFLSTLRERSGVPVILLLTEGQRLREREPLDHLERRVADWRRLGRRAGVADDRVLELDLDHITSASGGRLAAVLGVGDGGASSPRHVDRAFSLIVDHARTWDGQPEAAEQAELHRAIARLYQSDSAAWRDLLKVPVAVNAPRIDDLRAGADRMLTLLPARLRREGHWLAAGGVAGVFGCVAAATLVVPAAIASLPLWAGLGAATVALLRSYGDGDGDSSGDAVTNAPIDLSDAIAGAALFTLVLELQGRDEAAISRILDRVIADDESLAIGDAEAAAAWLQRLRARLDSAIGEETVS